MKLRIYPSYLMLLGWACLTMVLAHIALTQVCPPSLPLLGAARAEPVPVPIAGQLTKVTPPMTGIVASHRVDLAVPEVFPPALNQPTAPKRAAPKVFLGHRAYASAYVSQLITVGSYTANRVQRYEQLEHAAGHALMAMLDAARADGVWIIPVSGFRDYEEQAALFEFQKQVDGSPRLAARSVAPPGYSEHHTGYAVDLADGLARAKDISPYFEETSAFEWLSRRAYEFGFELSFPEDNDQGVAYEPWHWRYVGSAAAAAVFERAGDRLP